MNVVEKTGKGWHVDRLIGRAFRYGSRVATIKYIDLPGRPGLSAGIYVTFDDGTEGCLTLKTVVRELAYVPGLSDVDKARIWQMFPDIYRFSEIRQCWVRSCRRSLPNHKDNLLCYCNTENGFVQYVCSCGTCLAPEYFIEEYRNIRLERGYWPCKLVGECRKQVERLGGRYKDELDARKQYLLEKPVEHAGNARLWQGDDLDDIPF